jgi:hypothetical protein
MLQVAAGARGAYKQAFFEIEFFAIKIKMDFLKSAPVILKCFLWIENDEK